MALAAVPPTSPVNAWAYWTTVTGRSGRVVDTEPEHGHGLAQGRELGEHGGDHDPLPDGALEDVAHGGHAGELHDEQVDAEGEGGGEEDLAEREAAEGGQLGRVDAREGRARLAEVAQEDLQVLERGAGAPGKGRRLEIRE